MACASAYHPGYRYISIRNIIPTQSRHSSSYYHPPISVHLCLRSYFLSKTKPTSKASVSYPTIMPTDIYLSGGPTTDEPREVFTIPLGANSYLGSHSELIRIRHHEGEIHILLHGPAGQLVQRPSRGDRHVYTWIPDEDEAESQSETEHNAFSQMTIVSTHTTHTRPPLPAEELHQARLQLASTRMLSDRDLSFQLMQHRANSLRENARPPPSAGELQRLRIRVALMETLSDADLVSWAVEHEAARQQGDQRQL